MNVIVYEKTVQNKKGLPTLYFSNANFYKNENQMVIGFSLNFNHSIYEDKNNGEILSLFKKSLVDKSFIFQFDYGLSIPSEELDMVIVDVRYLSENKVQMESNIIQ
ncbi:hypothetical protein [Paraliobacillus ryukyuensis]|uniref:hypothetical protein n=1 Tax=Paraliobacillus ryukyuensis TaxID=200904 RepID=UPI0009A68671|nr:hypothetical protein [Paraliobacillus ryukyuensis]